MLYNSIEKHPDSLKKTPNLLHYADTRAAFSWETIRAELPRLPGGRGFNIGHAAVDCHADGPLHDHLALQWLGSDDTCRTFTYGELKAQSNRFANILGDLGVETVYGIIYPPQVALVGFGKIIEQPWAEDGMLGVRPVLTATLAADHRATDGHRGAQFLDALNRNLQEPAKL